MKSSSKSPRWALVLEEVQPCWGAAPVLTGRQRPLSTLPHAGDAMALLVLCQSTRARCVQQADPQGRLSLCEP